MRYHHRMRQHTASLIAVLIIIVATMCALITPAHAKRTSYFNMSETRSENLQPFPKWTGMMGRYGKQSKVPDQDCDKIKYHPCAIQDWKQMLESVRERPLREQLEAVNKWGNEHPYIVDQLNWGMEDYWETPFEFMSVNGDCEDYAIAKYYSMRALGLPEDKMRIIIVQDFNLGGIIHAILGVYNGDDLLILDNQAEQIIAAMKIYHYRPIYGVNENWWWAYYPKG